MAKVSTLYPLLNIPEALRNIADDIEEDRIHVGDTGCTLVIAGTVHHLGVLNDREAALCAVFNLTHGTHRMMEAVDDEDQ